MIDDPSLIQARKALRENQSLLDREKNKIAYNLNTALLAIVSRLEKIEQDVGYLHNKLQPILQEISSDADLVRRIARGSDYE